MPQVKRILCSIDLSEHSERVVSWAMDIAREYACPVVLLSVIEDFFPYTQLYKSLQDVGVAKAMDDVRAEMGRELERFAVAHREAGVSVETSVRTGHPDREIVDAARESGADLIVIGSHGRTGVEHALLGSVAEKVLRKAHCPVLTVKQAPPTE